MLEFMLDTNICIYAMKGRPPELVGRFKAHADRICTSAIVLAELRFGVEKSTRRQQSLEALDAFVAMLDVLPFDERAAAHYGELRAALERAGTPCGQADMQIGAHARSLGMRLVTNNRREFDRMPGVLVENWV